MITSYFIEGVQQPSYHDPNTVLSAPEHSLAALPSTPKAPARSHVAFD
jgi:hypothetical protein